ncbi:uncharacterized protein LOC133311577 [Gastrolobium bilobum]|uniref:uncharacterized protein LOC133311577 n=1 Tax=Gastrolobium bilobum TaxID=150636 RepID=UPI002AAF9E8E|nr:uncharacterized protein LOC133311577 [Gastrolobium bilobum]
MAEAEGNLIGLLFDFLKFPLGTIMCLQSKSMKNSPKKRKSMKSTIAADENLDGTQPNKIGSIGEIGCINNLYQSVINLDADVFLFPTIYQNMFICPRNPSENLCQKKVLRLNVSDQELQRESFRCKCCCVWSQGTLAGTSCMCGKILMDRHCEETSRDTDFINGKSKYLIFNDLKVLQSSPNNCVEQLVQLGYKNFNELTEMFINVDLKEMLGIVNQALVSESPLNDLFLMNGESKQTYVRSPKIKQKVKSEFEDSHSNSVMNLNVMVRKSKNEILVLTTPYASILELFGMNFSYQSLNDLNSLGFTSPSLSLFTCTKDPTSCMTYRTGERGFVRRQSLFIVGDDLQVTPCGNTSGISFLQKLNVPLDDLQKHVVSIGETEALNLLRASLTTKAALSQGLSYLLKKPEEETKAGNLRFE